MSHNVSAIGTVKAVQLTAKDVDLVHYAGRALSFFVDRYPTSAPVETVNAMNDLFELHDRIKKQLDSCEPGQ